MNTLTCVRSANSNLSSKILSGGDEKVLRLFEAPYNFVKAINTLSERNPQIQFRSDISNYDVESQIETDSKKQGALGLMNKAPILLANKGLRVDDEEEGGAGGEFDPVTVLTNVNKQKELIKITEPPVE